MVKIYKKDNLFGIIENNDIFVPCVYSDPLKAIEEWKYFEYDNYKAEKHRKYLNSNKSLEDIKRIEKELINSINLLYLY